MRPETFLFACGAEFFSEIATNYLQMKLNVLK